MTSESTSSNLRLWPGVVIVVLQWMATWGLGLIVPGTPTQFFGLMAGPPIGLLLMLIWWFFASRAAKRDRVAGVILPFVFLFAAFPLAHSSMPMIIVIYGIPIVCTAFVLWAALSRHWTAALRLRSLVVMLLVTCGIWTLLRSDGVDGNMTSQFSFRWQATPEEQMLADEEELPPVVVVETSSAEVAEPSAATPEPVSSEDLMATADDSSGDSADALVDEDELSSEDSMQPADSVPDDATPPAPASALLSDDAASSATAPPQPSAATWTSFRGDDRNAVVPGTTIAVDWQATPPQELWRRPVGPGWSSFALWNDVLYTQEQRGDDEVVSAYNAATGQPIWRHGDPVRFWEAMAGAGPRATPTIHDGSVYALGATGLLNALDAVDGSLRWSRNVADDSAAKVPEWGFSSSPLVVDGLVVVHTGAPDDKGLVAYDVNSGEPRWFAPAPGLSYSSAHLANLGGVDQLLILTSDGASSHAIDEGTVLWQNEWPMNGARVVQPVVTDDDHVLIGTGFGLGLRSLAVTADGDAWQVEERWTSRAMKPYFNDLVLHRDKVYGFDDRILACVDLATGERCWKGGRYGNGQVVLLSDQDLLLVLSDRGDVALVSAKPDAFEEIARFTAISGKTWNHPVVVDGVLYVRNAEEMAAFRLPAADGQEGNR